MSVDTFNNNGRPVGIITAILFHAALLLILFSVVSSVNPPKEPPQKELLVEFEPEAPKIETPREKNPAPAETIKIGKPEVRARPDTKPNNKQPKQTQPTATPSGDVELPIPEQPKETIKPGTLFTAATGKPQDDATSKPNATFPGSPDGNSESGATGSGTGNDIAFSLGGRAPVGTPPQPTHSENVPSKDGVVVVVEISVDPAGKVTSARAGVSNDKDKTTTSNKNLWDAARKAALNTRFTDITKSSTQTQYGYIVYRFRWK